MNAYYLITDSTSLKTYTFNYSLQCQWIPAADTHTGPFKYIVTLSSAAKMKPIPQNQVHINVVQLRYYRSV